jgi:outer membrane protein OmpA-like peptidoglycan-associated protein
MSGCERSAVAASGGLRRAQERRSRMRGAWALVGVFSMGCAELGTVARTRTAQGAAIGSVLGAIAGAGIARHNHARDGGGAVLGAVVGALAGGLAGRYLDQQAQQLDAIPGAEISRRDGSLLVAFSSELLFDSGSAQLEPGAYDRLRSLARTLSAYPQSAVRVSGHTDSTGGERLNQRLSEERADRVLSFLVAEGVSVERIVSVGFGSSLPVASNASTGGRARNRRVEIEITPERGDAEGDEQP